MRLPVSSSAIAVILGSFAALTGCGGAAPNAPAIASVQETRSLKDSNLLYVVNSDNLYVYTYPQGKLVQTFTYFGGPFGECVDARGDVFITLQESSEVVEYAHGASTPKLTLPLNSSYTPYGCAVNPKNGDLAVALTSNSTGGSALVDIFPNDRSGPIVHPFAGGSVFYCAYDGKGNLFVEQQGYYSGSYQTNIFEFNPSRHRKWPFKIFPEYWLRDPGGVQWDGGYLTVGDTDKTIYRFSIADGKATKVGKTTLAGAGRVAQFMIDGTEVIGGSLEVGTVNEWKYPAGGRATKLVSNLPAGTRAVVISPAK